MQAFFSATVGAAPAVALIAVAAVCAVTDLAQGKIYNAVMSVSPDGQTLTVHGYIGIELFGRDETWTRLPDTAMAMIDPSVVAMYMPPPVPAAGPRPPAAKPKTTPR